MAQSPDNPVQPTVSPTKSTKPNRARGLGSYLLSLLLIVVPIGVAYYLHVQNQTDYHQERAFRALGEVGELMEQNIGAVGNLFKLLPEDFEAKSVDMAKQDVEKATDELADMIYKFSKDIRVNNFIPVFSPDAQNKLDEIVEKLEANDAAENIDKEKLKTLLQQYIDAYKIELSSEQIKLLDKRYLLEREINSYRERVENSEDYFKQRAESLIRYYDNINRYFKDVSPDKCRSPVESDDLSSLMGELGPACFMAISLDIKKEFLTNPTDKPDSGYKPEYTVKQTSPDTIINFDSFKNLKAIVSTQEKAARTEQTSRIDRSSMFRGQYYLTDTMQFFEDVFKKQLEQNSKAALKKELLSKKSNYDDFVNKLPENSLAKKVTVGNFAEFHAEYQIVQEYIEEINELNNEIKEAKIALKSEEETSKLEAVESSKKQIRIYLSQLNKRSLFSGIQLKAAKLSKEQICDKEKQISQILKHGVNEHPSPHIVVVQCASVTKHLVPALIDLEMTEAGLESSSGAKEYPLSLSVPLDSLLNEVKYRNEFDRLVLADAKGKVYFELETTEFGAGEVTREGSKRFDDVSTLLHRATLVASGVDLELPESKTIKNLMEDKEEHLEVGQAVLVELKRGDSAELAFIQPFASGLSTGGEKEEKSTQKVESPKNQGINVFVEQNNHDESNKAENKDKTQTLYVIGLVGKNRFNTQLLKVSTNIITLASLVFIFGLLATPFIKLALNGENASVSRSIAILTIICGIISVTLLSLILTHITIGASMERAFDRTAEKVAGQLNDDVRLEISQSLYDTNEIFNPDAADLTHSHFERTKDYNIKQVQSPKKVWPPFQFAGSFNRRGRSSMSGPIVSYRQSATGGVNLSEREYFRRARDEDVISFELSSDYKFFKLGSNYNFNNKKVVPLALERVVNYSDGIKTTTLAIGRNKTQVTEPCMDNDCPMINVLGGPLKSFATPVMPLGFHYSVFNEKTGLSVANDRGYWGLTENLIRETDHNPELITAIGAQQAVHFDGRYYGQSVHFQTQPIAGTGWMGIVHYSQKFLQAIGLQILLITLAEVMAILLLALLPVLLFFFYRSDRWDWIFPLRYTFKGIGHFFEKLTYYGLALVLAVAIAIVLIFEGYDRMFGLVLIIHALVYVLYLSSGQALVQERYAYRLWKNPVIASLLLLMIIAVFLWAIKGGRIDFSFFLALTTLVTAALLTSLGFGVQKLYLVHKASNSNKAISDSSPWRAYIYAMIISAIVVGAIPAIASYHDAYISYNTLVHRYAQLDAAKKIEKRHAFLREYAAALDPEKVYKEGMAWTEEFTFGEDEKGQIGIFTPQNIYSRKDNSLNKGVDRVWLNWGPYVSNDNDNLKAENPAYLLADIIPSVGSLVSSVSSTISSQTDSGQWHWQQAHGQTKFLYKTDKPEPGGDGHGLILTFHDVTYNELVMPGHWAAFFAGMLVLTFYLYRMLGIIARQVTGLNVPIHYLHPDKIKIAEAAKTEGHLMIIRPTGHRLETLNNNITDENETRHDLNLATNDLFEKKWDKYTDKDRLVVTGFEVLISDAERRAQALTLLERLVHDFPKMKITLLCDYNLLFRIVRPDAYKDELGVDQLTHAAERLRWSGLIASFCKEYDWYPGDPKEWYKWQEADSESKATYEREARFFPDRTKFDNFAKIYLPTMEVEKEEPDKNDDEPNRKEEDINFKECLPGQIIDIAGMYGGAYYRKLWAESPHAEKLAMYQLAKGKMLNTRNIELIGHLMRRGLVVAEPQLKLTSESFKCFVLAAETIDTYTEWEEGAARSMWHIYRIPLIVLMIVLAVFLLNTAKQEIDAALAVLGGALTLVPVLLRGFSIIKGPS